MFPLSTLLGTLLLAQAPPPMPPPMRPPMPPPILALAEDLGLAPEQITKLHTLLEGRRAALEAGHHKAREADRALEEAARDLAVSDARLRELHEAASAARFDALREGRTLHREALAILTAEQRKAYDTFEKREVGPREGHGRGGPGHPGGGRPDHRGQRHEGPPPPPCPQGDALEGRMEDAFAE